MKVRQFETSGESQASRARWMWQILTGYVAFQASDPIVPELPKGLMSYMYLRTIMGYDQGAEVTLGGPLGYIKRYCEGNSLSLLNCVVVKKTTGIAGLDEMFPNPEAHIKEQIAVRNFGFGWVNMRAPTTSEFRKYGSRDSET